MRFKHFCWLHAPRSPGCRVLVKLLKLLILVKMIQISNIQAFSGNCSSISLSERRHEKIAQLLRNIFFVPRVLSVVFLTPFPWMSVSFLSGIISWVSGDTDTSVPALASDKHFLSRTSLSHNVPVLSSNKPRHTSAYPLPSWEKYFKVSPVSTVCMFTRSYWSQKWVSQFTMFYPL